MKVPGIPEYGCRVKIGCQRFTQYCRIPPMEQVCPSLEWVLWLCLAVDALLWIQGGVGQLHHCTNDAAVCQGSLYIVAQKPSSTYNHQ